MAWVYLIIAGLFEVIWATAMKQSVGFTRLSPTLVTLLFLVLSFLFLSVAMKSLPLGTAYTIWVGVGAIGTYITNIILVGENFNIYQAIAISFIMIGVILLKFTAH